MLADAFPERANPEPQTWRRAGLAVVVALLHLVFLYGLLNAINVRAVPRLLSRVPITIWIPTPPPKTLPEKKKPEQQENTETPVAPTTAPITIPRAPAKPRDTDDDGIGKLGRYLTNCSNGNYEKLSPQEWADCLGGMATRDRNGNTIKLGDVQTLWEKQHPKQWVNPKEATGFGECAHNDPKRLMGLPCFQHNGEKPSVLNGQR